MKDNERQWKLWGEKGFGLNDDYKDVARPMKMLHKMFPNPGGLDLQLHFHTFIVNKYSNPFSLF